MVHFGKRRLKVNKVMKKRQISIIYDILVSIL